MGLMNEIGRSAGLKVSGVVSSNMVFQRAVPICIRGTAGRSGLMVFGEFLGERKTTVTDEEGNWRLTFSPHSAVLEPQTLKLETEAGDLLEFHEILVGDVYFITGQSNAEMTLNQCIAAYPEDQKDLTSDTVRLFTQTREYVINHPEVWKTPQDDVVNPAWRWNKTTEETAYAFSALGYYFGKELSKTITDVPIGLIMAAAGGAQISELMPEETAKQQGYTISAAVGIAGYYNTLIHPFLHTPIRAMLFYQGESESNPQNCGQYGKDLEEFVKALRTKWGSSFKFYNVQLSSHGKISYDYWPSIGDLRAAQFEAINHIPDYYLAAALDCGFQEGDPDFAHPLYKKAPGQRLARLVLSAEYGLLDMEYASSPYPVSAQWKERCVQIGFRCVGEGLKLFGEGTHLTGFQIEKNGERKDAAARITGKNMVEVSCPGEAEAVCYGMQQLAGPDIANLSNSESLPSPAFRLERKQAFTP